MTEAISILSTLATQGAMPALLALYGKTGATADVVFAPTNGLMASIRSGNRGDVAILTKPAMAELTAGGVTTEPIDIACSRVGIAVRAGAAKPSIANVDELKRSLLAARSIAYSRTGASGLFFAGLIERLGLAAEVNAKARVIPEGLTGTYAASGEVELAVQQISELRAVPGIDVVGPLPAGHDGETVFTAGLFAGSPHAVAGARFLDLLTSADGLRALTNAGLEPPPR